MGRTAKCVVSLFVLVSALLAGKWALGRAQYEQYLAAESKTVAGSRSVTQEQVQLRRLNSAVKWAPNDAFYVRARGVQRTRLAILTQLHCDDVDRLAWDDVARAHLLAPSWSLPILDLGLFCQGRALPSHGGPMACIKYYRKARQLDPMGAYAYEKEADIIYSTLVGMKGIEPPRDLVESMCGLYGVSLDMYRASPWLYRYKRVRRELNWKRCLAVSGDFSLLAKLGPVVPTEWQIMVQEAHRAGRWPAIRPLVYQKLQGESAAVNLAVIKGLTLSGNQKEAFNLASKYISTDPTDWDAWLLMRDICRRYGEAVDWSRVARLMEAATASGRPTPAVAAYFAKVFCSLKDYRRSADVIETSLQSNPHSSVIYNGLGDCLRSSGQLDESERAYILAAKFDPGNGDHWFNAAQIRVIRGDYVGALKALDNALKIDPHHEGAKRLVDKISGG